MFSARCTPTAFLLSLLLFSSLHSARAESPPAVDSSTRLVVLNVANAGFANVRSQPDPRSAIVAKMLSGSTDLRATGETAKYGDTWWLEIETSGMRGWVNSRLIGDESTGSSLAPFVNIEDLHKTTDYAFLGTGYHQAPSVSYEECARRCVSDTRCQSLEFRRDLSVCVLLAQRPDVVQRRGRDLAVKSSSNVPTSSTQPVIPRFDVTLDHEFEDDGFRQLIAWSTNGCMEACAEDRRCVGIEFQRGRRVCALFTKAARMVPRVGFEVAVRSGAVPGAGPIDAKTAPVRSDPRPVATSTNYRDIAQHFFNIFEGAPGILHHTASADIDKKGLVRFSMSTAGQLGRDTDLAVPATVYVGNAHNLAAHIDPFNQRIVHVVFLIDSPRGKVPLVSETHANEEAAKQSATKLQADIDALARMTGLGPDQYADMKPHRK